MVSPVAARYRAAAAGIGMADGSERSDALISVSGLRKNFGAIRAVDDVSFSVNRGEVLGFLGPNGAGKSTTMRMITGFLRPDAGQIRIGGDDIDVRPVDAKRRIGYLPEGAPLYADMTPRTFLDFIADVRGLDATQRAGRIDQVIDQINLGSVLDQPVETLSKGFKRRLGLAQAILHDPEVLVLDEPTDGLDPNQKHEVRNLIRAMAPTKAIILSTHILEEVDAVCTRAVIIAGGKLVADGTPEELAARSSSHNVVRLRLPGPAPESMPQRLQELACVASVEIDDHTGGAGVIVSAIPAAGASALPDINRLIHQHGWPVAEVWCERGRMDEVFREVTGTRQAPT